MTGINAEIPDEQRIIDEVVNILLSYLQPKRIILFGSRARQRAGEYADFDIAIEGADMDIKVERFIKDKLPDKGKLRSGNQEEYQTKRRVLIGRD